MGLSRKLKRNKIKKSKKDFKTALGLFDKLEDHCLACDKPYDKKNKEHVTTWKVVVREKEKKVNLYCPECWDSANKVLDGLKERIDAKLEQSNS